MLDLNRTLLFSIGQIQFEANYCHVAVILLLEGSNLIKKCEE